VFFIPKRIPLASGGWYTLLSETIADVSMMASNDANATPLTGLKILIVEDDQLLSDLLAKKLVQAGCTPLHAVDGAEGLKRMHTELPDLVVLDILMPGMSGFEVLQQIRRDASFANIPVILLSNLGQEQDIDRGKELGAANFLIKATVTLDEIVDEIRRVRASAAPK
jgi:DNA-binding response OmpR family regulator